MANRSAEYDLVLILTYYSPHVSGLTETARRIAEGLANRKWRVAVVASQHHPSLPRREVRNQVTIFRSRVLMSIGKGVVSPSLSLIAGHFARNAQVVNLHLPMLEAGLVAQVCGSTPLVSTYHCDVTLPRSRWHTFVTHVMDASARRALARSRAIVVSTADYARSCRLRTAIEQHQQVISPPCREHVGGEPVYRDGAGLHVGFLGRIVADKGIEHLIDGFVLLNDPAARLMIAGDYLRVAGGSTVSAVRRRIGGDPRIRLLGFVPDRRLRDFYASLDVFVLPSVNSFEAFGIAQVEAMMCGVPVIASDLPGVRVPVMSTGFGWLVPPGNPEAISAALRVARHSPLNRHRGTHRARSRFGGRDSITAYHELFRSLA